jgi:hypothetical protein
MVLPPEIHVSGQGLQRRFGRVVRAIAVPGCFTPGDEIALGIGAPGRPGPEFSIGYQVRYQAAQILRWEVDREKISSLVDGAQFPAPLRRGPRFGLKANGADHDEDEQMLLAGLLVPLFLTAIVTLALGGEEPPERIQTLSHSSPEEQDFARRSMKLQTIGFAATGLAFLLSVLIAIQLLR